MALCNFQKNGNVVKCTRCGNEFPASVGVDAIANCGRMGLGDYVAWGLKKVGIRKRAGCGCAKRQKKLNKIY